MEEMLGNHEKVRQIFEDWMTWDPRVNAWDAYIEYELRRGNPDKCRAIIERYTDVFPGVDSFLKAANFEIKQRNHENARKIFEKAMSQLGRDALNPSFLMSFIKFEIKAKQIERAELLF